MIWRPSAQLARLATVPADVFDEVCTVLRPAMRLLNVPGHLFVTVVACDSLDDGGGRGYALYMSGLRHIAISSEPPEEFDGSRADWLGEIRLSLVHELIHYKQELEGTLEATIENERATEELAVQILGRLPTLLYSIKGDGKLQK